MNNHSQTFCADCGADTKIDGCVVHSAPCPVSAAERYQAIRALELLDATTPISERIFS